MPSILTAEDVVRRIAAECTFVDDQGGGRNSGETGGRDSYSAAIRRAIPPATPT